MVRGNAKEIITLNGTVNVAGRVPRGPASTQDVHLVVERDKNLNIDHCRTHCC